MKLPIPAGSTSQKERLHKNKHQNVACAGTDATKGVTKIGSRGNAEPSKNQQDE